MMILLKNNMLKSVVLGFCIINFVSRIYAVETVQLMSKGNLEAVRNILPKVEEASIFDHTLTLQEILLSPQTMWYTNVELPQAYQVGGGLDGNEGKLRFSDPLINISNARGEGDKPNGEGGNLNIQDPWEMRPGGTSRCLNLRDIKGFYLPLNEKTGKLWPVAVYERNFVGQRFARDVNLGTDWIFPVGTVFLEILIQHYDSVDYVFEIRVRIRVTGMWEKTVMKPFQNGRDLSETIKKLSRRWYQDQVTRDLIGYLKNNKSGHIRMTQPGENQNDPADDIVVLERSYTIDFVPELSSNHDKLCAYLLKNIAFKDCLEET